VSRAQRLTLGVVLPCRDEAPVLERKLRNLARAAWPAGRHRVVVVDDGSSDATYELGRHLADELFPLELATDPGADAARVVARVVRNRRSAGKPGAITTGIESVTVPDSTGPAVDLVVLSDADVVLEPTALASLVAAFEADPSLAMACGAQWFVRDLDGSGAFRGADGAPLVRVDGRYDRWTAVVRRLESRTGRLFSVHGQLLAWRASLELRATPGLAADDLDLRHQVRARSELPRRIELVPRAVFAEVKEVASALDEQAVRRARAYLQTVSWRRAPALPDGLDRLQLALYRLGPLAAPWLLLAGVLALPCIAGALFGPIACAVVVLVLALLSCTPAGRRLVRLMKVIVRARAEERAAPLADRWRMARR